MSRVRLLVLAATTMLPWAIKRRLYNSLFGWRLHRSARIGFALVSADVVEMGSYAKIRSFTVIRNLSLLQLGEHASIGTFNWVFGMPIRNRRHFRSETSRSPQLIIGAHASITSRHIIDATNSVRVGAYSTVAGFYTQIITHGIDIAQNQQQSEPITIGEHSLIGTGSILLKGATVPNFCIVAAGSVVGHQEFPEYSLIAGSPAKAVKALRPTSAYFTRTSGFVE